MRDIRQENARPIQGILAGTALGAAFWIVVLLVVALLAEL
jgi:hypothetical protein